MNIKLIAVSLAVSFAFTTFVGGAATFSVSYNDGGSEGFNDPGSLDSESQNDGNPGTTLGEQRQWAFEQALDFWGDRLESNLTIEVNAEMNDLSCDDSSAVLGSAGANTVHANWTPAAGGSTPEFSNTWYGQALANRIANKDNSGDDRDINSVFNKMIDESDNCLGSNTWYYALLDPPPGTVSFYKTVLHEIAHGVNFQNFVNETNGSRLSGLDDVYMHFSEDHSTGKTWVQMTDQEREDSAIDTNDLHWIGSEVIAASDAAGGDKTGGHVHLYAPDPVEPGSSASHWDIGVDDRGGNSELMEPSATGTEKIFLTDELLEDLGWNEFSACGPALADEITITLEMPSSAVTYEACRILTMGPDFVAQSGAEVTAAAPYGVAVNGQLIVEEGATFLITLDQSIGSL